MATIRPLHIAISARAISLPYGGVREYIGGLLDALIKLDSPHRFSIYYASPELLGRYPTAHEVLLRAPHKFFWDHSILPLRLHHDRPDVVWFPHNVISLGCQIPSVVTIHDLLYFPMPEFPQREYAWIDSLYMRLFIPPSLRKARKVTVNSQWTANDIIRLTGTPAEKISVTYPALSLNYHRMPATQSQAVRATYGLQQPFFFYAGTLSPRKNVRVLIEAFGRVSRDLPHDLVITGGPGYREVPYDDLLERYAIAHRVRRLGLVSREDLIALYHEADAFIFPSRYEGFGIPPLEAMACGCPVISSRATSLAEVVGQAGLLFEPDDSKLLAQHMLRIANEPGLRQTLIHAGFEQVTRFSYQHSAQTLLTMLEDAY
ncbi:glycosyltransferase family 4 protein [Candidatus Oscillochloris fontis]|uniref:glycosyltransferase family 4 protein n=1 Tax=Candidatus Oscillochloris fontis TaxID=2496868 RepID=UPI00101D9025|nr:glycosyltransferase family 1 protein [Candidatus Oscillochloris fontis]